MLRIILVALFFVVACQKSPDNSAAPAVQVEKDVAESVEANQKAQTYSEWHSSEKHPEKLFAGYVGLVLQKKMTSRELCRKLNALSSSDLAVFENQIRADENQFAISECQQDLISDLDMYWLEQQGALEQLSSVDLSPTEVRFPDTLVQLRDVSQGYYAVTGDLKAKQVVLTFDDGPSGLYTDQILQTLKRANVRVIFFQLGQQVRRFPEITQRVAKNGHSIGSHSTTHACLPSKNLCRKANGGRILTVPQAMTEIRGGHQAIYDAIGWVDPFVRFPFGEASPELKDYLRKNSIGEFLWNVDSEDWREKLDDGRVNSMSVMIDNVMKALNARQRGILLFHDIQKRTAEALPTLLKRLHKDGYQPVVFQATDNQARFNSRIVGPRKPIN